MSHILLYMPRGGEDGYILTQYTNPYLGLVYKVRFDGQPYSQWDIGDDTPMIRLHSALESVNISDFQNGILQSMTFWNEEWDAVRDLIVDGFGGYPTVSERKLEDIPYAVVQRLRMIDTLLFHEMPFNRDFIASYFGISNVQVAADVKLYNEIAPKNMKYNMSKRHFESTIDFQRVWR